MKNSPLTNEKMGGVRNFGLTHQSYFLSVSQTYGNKLSALSQSKSHKSFNLQRGVISKLET